MSGLERTFRRAVVPPVRRAIRRSVRGLTRRRSRPPRRAINPGGTVYFIGDGEHVKIGFTSGDPHDRMKDLQTGSSRELTLLASEPGSMADERALHARFASARIRSSNEWFRLTPSIRRYMAGKREIPWHNIGWLVAITVACLIYLFVPFG